MKYAGSYRQTEYYEYMDEIHFGKLSTMLDYIIENQGTKPCCLEILNMKDRSFNNEPVTNELYHSIITKYPNVRLEFYELKDLLNYAKDYFGTQDKYSFHFPADTYNLLNTLLRLKVSDILLDEPFVFEIERIYNFIKFQYQDCKIHIRPYIGKPSYMLSDESVMHHFWVLPQHLYLYEEYVDVVDIFADSIERERRLLDIYCVKHEYTNLLGPLVNNYTEQDKKMCAGYVPLKMAEDRLNCKQICCTRIPSICHICDRYWSWMQLITKDYAENVMQGKPSYLLEKYKNK